MLEKAYQNRKVPTIKKMRAILMKGVTIVINYTVYLLTVFVPISTKLI